MFLFIGLTVLFYISYHLYKYLFQPPNINPNGKYVLISGCDSGVGHQLAIELDKQGFNILAGVLLSDSVNSLKSKLSSNATVFHLDITKQEDIDAAFELVKDKTNTLHALVNNAGIIAHGCIDWISMEIMRKVMNVNFFGHVAMTKKFLPLLIAKCDSRVVNVASATGFLAFPNTSAYSASKHALEAFSDCLRREMSPWNLRVSIIEPGAVRTGMLECYEDYMNKLWKGLSKDVQDRWGTDYFTSIITQAANSSFTVYADDPNRVVRVIQHAVINTKPRIRYRPGLQAKLFFGVFCIFPTWLIDTILAKALHFIPAGVKNQLSN